MSKRKKYLLLTVVMFAVFVIFTGLIKNVDVKPVGPRESCVGFATINDWFRKLLGVHVTLYNITDWCSIITIPIGMIFLVIGLVEWIKRKKLFDVDGNILALGIFYILTFVCYAIFEFFVINRRPVLINEFLEASYPSSTTMLSLTVFVTAIDQVKIYISNKKIKYPLIVFLSLFSIFLIVGRIISGVHWLTDILGSIILSSALIFCYFGIKEVLIKKENK